MSVSDRRLDDEGGGSTVYLLFGGRYGQPGGANESPVASFSTEGAARAAFHDARLRLSDGDGWAELTVVVDGSRSRTLSWFGDTTGHRRRVNAGTVSPIDRPGRRQDPPPS